jgi:hypothetical protein
MVMQLVKKCRCPSERHGHKPGKCQNVATEPEQICKPCRDKSAGALSRASKRERPLRRLSKLENIKGRNEVA